MLTVTDLVVAYPNFTLGPIDLAAHAGDFVSVIGPNGSGKSTFIAGLLGLRLPDHGVCTWDGSDVARRDPDVLTRLSYVSDSPQAILDEFTAEEYWQYCRTAHEQARGEPMPEAISRAREYAALLDFPIHHPGTLSALSLGTRRKAQIIAALMTQPQLLVLDEPFIGLDFIASRALETVLRHVRDAGTVIVSSSHDLDLASRLSTRLLVLYNGQAIVNSTVAGVGGHRELEAVVMSAIQDSRLAPA